MGGLATGSSAERLKPLVTLIVGGMITSTALTLLALPTLYYMVGKRYDEIPKEGKTGD